MHTCRYISTTHTHTPFLEVLFTQPLLDNYLARYNAMKEANTLHTGRIKESQLFLTTQLRLLKCYPVSAILVDFFILMHIFNVSFDLLLLFFFPFYFSSFQSHSSSGFMKNAMFMCLSPSVILPASVMTFTDVSLCLCPSLRVVKLSFSLSVSLSPKRALRCLSVTPSLSFSRH